jgi:DNA repair exonuclease SbcCD nuclease subunit
MDSPDALSEAINNAYVSNPDAAYLFSHALVKGAVPGDKGIDPAALHPELFTRIILGDVHAPTHIKPNIDYIGALLPLHFGDAASKRGCAILDTDKNTFEFIENNHSPKFHVIRDGLVRNISPKDFVRVSMDVGAADVAKRVTAIGAWVEANAPPPEADIHPRMDVRTSQSDEDMLREYIKHNDIGLSPEDLLKIGMECMQEARACS